LTFAIGSREYDFIDMVSTISGLSMATIDVTAASCASFPDAIHVITDCFPGFFPGLDQGDST